MTYQQFTEAVGRAGWTVAELRCDVPPSADILELIETIGHMTYETYVARYMGAK